MVYNGPMRILFYIGWALLICAFVAAAAEQLVRLYPGGSTLVTPAYDLWYTVAPHSLTITQIRIERFWPQLWDPVIVFILVFPAWFLLGVPGVFLAWRCRPGRFMTPREREDFRKYVESLFLYDKLAKEAKAAGHASGPDDMSPDHSGHQALDDAEQSAVDSDDELIEAIIADRRATNERPSPD